jgi:hypothetical protein
MKLIRIALIVAVSLIYITGFSQVTKIPPAAKDNFAKQYPKAENASWDNDVVNVNVRFDLDGEKMNAEYNNKGHWKSTIKDLSFDKLPPAVLDGFKKSKYADREVTETKMIYYPANEIKYRLKVEKNDVEKKYLFFDENGRLLRDAITL